MTAKDYRTLAAAFAANLATIHDPEARAAVVDVLGTVADVAGHDNPSFDRNRFMTAAGVTNRKDTPRP